METMRIIKGMLRTEVMNRMERMGRMERMDIIEIMGDMIMIEITEIATCEN